MSGEELDAGTEAKLDKAINEGLAQWLADRRDNPYTVVARAAYRVGVATWAKELAGQVAALVAERDEARADLVDAQTQLLAFAETPVEMEREREEGRREGLEAAERAVDDRIHELREEQRRYVAPPDELAYAVVAVRSCKERIRALIEPAPGEAP